MSQTIFTRGAAPATPPAGKCTQYAKSDGRFYWKDEFGVETPFKSVGAGSGDLLADGTIPLTADWNVGTWKITANQFESVIVTGTAPLIVASTTLVANLNADQLDGQEGSYYASVAYVDAAVLGALVYMGGYNATTNTPDLTTSPNSIIQGHFYVVETAGTFFGVNVEVGDSLIAEQDDPSAIGHWTVLQANLDAATIKTQYESNADTNAYTDSEKTDVAAAILDGDFSPAEGFMRKTGAGAYTAVKSNLTAIVPPTADDDSGDGYGVGSIWVDTVLEVVWTAIDVTVAAAVWSSGGGGITALYKTGAYTAVSADYIFANSEGGIFTITLPASPDANDTVIVKNCGGATTNPITIGRNGETIQGLAEDFVLDQDWGQVEFIYTGTDWKHAVSGTPDLVNVNDYIEGIKVIQVEGLSDDDVWVYDFGENVFAGTLIFGFNVDHGTIRNGIFSLRAAATNPYINAMASNGITTTTGVLTGTTGADSMITISTHTDHKLYIENRHGSAITFVVTITVGVLEE